MAESRGTAAAVVVVASLGATPCWSAESASCEPRQEADPERLNVEAAADGYGFAAPCSASVRFYIGRASPLQSVGGTLSLVTAEGVRVHAREIRADLENTGYGILETEVELDSIEAFACQSLVMRVDYLRCRGERGSRMACPEVRVRASPTVRELQVEGDEVDVCFDP